MTPQEQAIAMVQQAQAMHRARALPRALPRFLDAPQQPQFEDRRDHTATVDNGVLTQYQGRSTGTTTTQAPAPNLGEQQFATLQIAQQQQQAKVEGDYVKGIREGIIKGEFRTNPFTGFLERKVQKADPNNPLVKTDAWELADGGMQQLFRKNYSGITGQQAPEQTSLLNTQVHQSILKTIKPQFREMFMQNLNEQMSKGVDYSTAVKLAAKPLPDSAALPHSTTPSATITVGDPRQRMQRTGPMSDAELMRQKKDPTFGTPLAGTRFLDNNGQPATMVPGIYDIIDGKMVGRAPVTPTEVATSQKSPVAPATGEEGQVQARAVKDFIASGGGNAESNTPAYSAAFPGEEQSRLAKGIEMGATYPLAWGANALTHTRNAVRMGVNFVNEFLPGDNAPYPMLKDTVTPEQLATKIYTDPKGFWFGQ